MTKKLHKSNKNRMLCGVCGGIAEYFNIDPTIVRLVVVVIALIKGAGLLLYLIAAVIIPMDDSESESEADIDNLKSANTNDENKKNAPHSDQEFDSFFKDKK